MLYMPKISIGTIGFVLALGIALAISAYLMSKSFTAYQAITQTDSVVVESIPRNTSWTIQSIDTMKQSRDLARGKARDAAFDAEIQRQVRAIADTGANSIALGTPYDKEFLPFMRRWIRAARANDLHVWFRGNWSGWEGWFEYPKTLSRADHIRKTVDFISNNSDLFEDGDILSPCPECENGGPGDPRQTGDTDGYRKFLIEEYRQSEAAFSTIDKKVRLLYPSNRDVAKLIMDPATTRALGGYVVIDHHISEAGRMATDLREIVASSGGRVVLGEFGVPEFDERGRKMTEKGKVAWMDTVLRSLLSLRGLEGVNYWVNTTGPTALWDETGEAHPMLSTLTSYFSPHVLYGTVRDSSLCPIEHARVSVDGSEVFTRYSGYFEIRRIGAPISDITVSASGFSTQHLGIREANSGKMNVILAREHPGTLIQEKWLYRYCLK